MRVETYSEGLFFTTAFISGVTAAGAQSTGTGFVYVIETDGGAVHLLVTNKHVLDGMTAVTVRFVRRLDSVEAELGAGTQITLTDFSPQVWTGHPDPYVDVAVMPLKAITDQMQAIGGAPFYMSVAPENCPRDPDLRSLDALEDVVIIGYPNGLYDTANLLPIARQGTTATPPYLDYQGKPAFLVDAPIYPGSSGSPVFLSTRGGMWRDRSGNVTLGQRIMCLGIVSAVHIRQVRGDVRQVGTGLAATFDDPIGLGIVYKSHTIDTCADVLLAAHGLQRRPGESPAAGEDEASEADERLAENSPLND